MAMFQRGGIRQMNSVHNLSMSVDMPGSQDKQNNDVYGKIIRLNPKTATIKTNRNTKWRVGYEWLQLISSPRFDIFLPGQLGCTGYQKQPGQNPTYGNSDERKVDHDASRIQEATTFGYIGRFPSVHLIPQRLALSIFTTSCSVTCLGLLLIS